jgi:FtsP/CotA-like multicopper oxidase with cupredoxin domain
VTVPSISRRQVLVGLLGAGASAGLAACSIGSQTSAAGRGAVAAVEPTAATGRIRKLTLQARPVEVDLGGQIVSTWAYGSSVPGAALRAMVGDRVQVAFSNDLPQATSVHWHGLAIRNDMDGVPGVTTPEVAAGGSFDFDFVVPDAGTHWFHPHSGLQLDRGLYAPFIVEDPQEPGAYDHEWVVVLDDWTDGVGSSPEDIFADLTSAGSGGSGGGDMGGMDMGGMDMGGMDGGDVDYPLYLINGGAPGDPDVLNARSGQRVRLRIINAAADTIFNVALAGHDLRITHTDGYPVVPVSTPLLQVGMGERYDAIVTLDDGLFALVAEPVGKEGSARALVRTGSGRVPPPSYRPPELDSFALTVDVLAAAQGSALPKGEPDTTQDLVLAGSMGPYVWTINDRIYSETVPLTIRQGQVGRLHIRNESMMPHPVHLHGHTFQIGTAGGRGPRKDTVLVPAMASVEVDLAADNPGNWMVHCHNAYHAEAGMMTRLEYAT